MQRISLRAMALLGLPALIHLPAATASFVTNPSFELDDFPAAPGYIGNGNPPQITDWSGTGGHGINRAAGPFHNGGTPIVDRLQTAFIQGNGSLSQTITGLTVGQTYWIQLFYDKRGCCGGSINLATSWDGAVLDTVTDLPSATGGAGYFFRNVPFTATAEEGLLTFTTTATGDASALLDAVSIVPGAAGQVIVANPSFEASGTPESPGYIPAGAGWTGGGAGQIAINDATGPFADNGSIPEQDHVVCIQGLSYIEQNLRGLVAGEKYSVSWRHNARNSNTPTLRVSVDTTVRELAVTPAGGTAAYQSGTVEFVATSTSAVLRLAQIAEGDQTVLLDDIRVTGVVVEPLPNLQVGPSRIELGPGSQALAAVTVSARRLEAGAATVKVRLADDTVARLVDADATGIVTLVFDQGLPQTTLTTAIEGVGRGSTILEVVDNGGHDGVDGSVIINGTTSYVVNPSFEAGPVGAGPGYGSIPAWTGGSGVNNASQPFFDNGLIPDRDQVAFLQNSGAMVQTVNGLTPGTRYALQAFYNVRACCGGTMALTVRFGGNELASVEEIVAVGPGAPFHFLNASFTATSASGVLEFAGTAAGDASLLLDGISIVPQDATEVIVKNPSFEASGIVAYPGYQTAIAGWTATGGHGVNVDTVGPFADNGIAARQDRVAFMQGTSSLAQTLDGLSPGTAYTLNYLVNARSGDTPGPTPYRVLIDSAEAWNEPVEAVGPGAPYVEMSLPFTATSETVEIRFEGLSTGTPQDDHTLLLDDIRVLPAGSSTAGVALTIRLVAGNSVNLAWPTSAPATLVLQSSTTMAPNSWQPVTTVPFIEGGNQNVLEVIDGPTKFYRLRQP